MPDGSFFIRNRGDLQNAISAVGRATPDAGESEVARRNAVRRHCIKRARALGLTDMIPDTWNSDGSLKQSILVREVEDYLEHFGVKGMKWGVRRGDNAGGDSRLGTSYQPGTNQVQLWGARKSAGLYVNRGRQLGRPVSPEASRARELQGQVKKYGTQSLSNKDLQDLVTRLNLERQYSNLSQPKVSSGRKFVNEVLRDSAKQIATQFITKNAPKGAAILAGKVSKEVIKSRASHS